MGRVDQRSPSADADAVSMHTTPDDYAYADLPQPDDGLPSYTDSEAEAVASSSSVAAHPQHEQDSFPNDEYIRAEAKKYRVESFMGAHNLEEVSTRLDERLNDPYKLYAYIMDCLRIIPPKPTVHIHGYHYETTHTNNNNSSKKEKHKVSDFDFYLSLQSNFAPAVESDFWSDRVVENTDKAYRGSWRKARAPGFKQHVQLSDEPAPDLKEWCDRFCESKARLKVFRIKREVAGIDTNVIEGDISNIIRATQYRGRLDISFPIEQKYVDIYSPHFINRWRTSWVRIIFYVTFLWILIWPWLFIMTKWYDVYTVQWNFSCISRSPSNPNQGIKKYATVTERQWVREHSSFIRNLVLNRFTGASDRIDQAMTDPAASTPQPHSSSAATTGNPNADSAIRFVRGGVNVWNQLSRGQTPDPQGWGYDT